MLYVQYNKALHVKRSGFQLTETAVPIKRIETFTQFHTARSFLRR